MENQFFIQPDNIGTMHKYSIATSATLNIPLLFVGSTVQSVYPLLPCMRYYGYMLITIFT